MLFDNPQLIEWNDFYPCPPGKVRMGLKLTNPKLFIDNQAALSHDFYYFSDEFTVLFHPLHKDSVQMLVEGPHADPQGERIPILSTWSNLKQNRNDVYKTGIQHIFAFYKNKWHDAELSYDYKTTSIDCSPYSNLHWCTCKGEPALSKFGFYGHAVYLDYRSNTIFDDKSKTELYYLYKSAPCLIADWFDDRGDDFCEYLRTYNQKVFLLPELQHMSQFLSNIENDRAVKLLLLAEKIRR